MYHLKMAVEPTAQTLRATSMGWTWQISWRVIRHCKEAKKLDVCVCVFETQC